MKILIVGAGGHARVIADIVRLQGHTVVGYLDDAESLLSQEIQGVPVIDRIDAYQQYSYDRLVLGIGDNLTRHAVHTLRLKDIPDDRWHIAIHPTAVVADYSVLGVGTVLMAGAVINLGTEVGRHVIINTGATIDHDCIIHDYAHVAPGVNLAGGVQVGSGTLVGIGSCSIPYTSIGAWSVIGAGSVVTKDIPANVTAAGVPARIIRSKTSDQDKPTNA